MAYAIPRRQVKTSQTISFCEITAEYQMTQSTLIAVTNVVLLVVVVIRFFTARSVAQRGTSRGIARISCPSVYPSVRPSVCNVGGL